jgi:ferredoxin
MKINVNKAICAGHARCWSLAPHLFPLDEEGYIATDSFEVKPGDEALARRGARACPERALSVVEDKPPGGKA